MSDRRHPREIPEPLLWLVDKLIEMHERRSLKDVAEAMNALLYVHKRGRWPDTGNIVVRVRPNSPVLVDVEETFRDTSPQLPWVEVKK